MVSEQPVSHVNLAEKLIPFGAKVLNLITMSPYERFSLLTMSPCQRFDLFFANPEEFAYTRQFGLKSGSLQRCITGFGR